jgi:hypothetical protein
MGTLAVILRLPFVYSSSHTPCSEWNPNRIFIRACEYGSSDYCLVHGKAGPALVQWLKAYGFCPLTKLRAIGLEAIRTNAGLGTPFESTLAIFPGLFLNPKPVEVAIA